MHAANIRKSDRLKRVLYVLRTFKKAGRPWASTRDIVVYAQVYAVSSAISELRANGKKIECKRTGNVWRYRLA